jgi:hypothetical protein
MSEDRTIHYSEIPKKSGINSLTSRKVIALLIFIKFTSDIMELRHLVHYSRRKTLKNGTMCFNIFTFIITALAIML